MKSSICQNWKNRSLDEENDLNWGFFEITGNPNQLYFSNIKVSVFFSQFFPGSTSKGPSSQGTQRKTLVQFLRKIKNGGVFYLSNTFLVNQDLISLEISTQKMIFSENFHKKSNPQHLFFFISTRSKVSL